MTPHEAAELLFPGLGLGNIDAGMQAEIRDAYSIMVKADHPDHGGSGKNVARLKEARTVLMDYTNGVRPKCPVCGGKGTVKGKRFAPEPCPKGCKVARSDGQTLQRRKVQGGRGFRP